MSHRRVVAVVGPTAAGKSESGCDLALAFDGEVVNCDSMQTYRGMDIGTAKLTRHQRHDVPHHLIDIWSIAHEANVAEYQRRARGAVEQICGRGRIPIFVGGSGLYLRAAIDDLRFPGTDPRIRRRWQSELERIGSAELHKHLMTRDQAAASAILPTNGRRIVRALEVIELTGSFEASMPTDVPYFACLQLGISLPRDVLDDRIAARVDAMFAAGLVREVRELRSRGLDASPTASRALGYPQICRLLDGEINETQARELIEVATRKFARRQLAWLRRDRRIEWVEGTDAQKLSLELGFRVRQWLGQHGSGAAYAV